ncbi:MAG: hypothetical protein KDB35_10125, partial [Acidimicrobiales bacterium]|nr:hypothetical protein [Acidimicrobiales bacterium]
FIEKRDEVQSAAESYIQSYLSRYEVETRGVYIQDVVFPPDLVEVLTSREIASQERATFAQQRAAQEARVSLEQQRGVADMQGELAQANVSVDIERSRAQAASARAEGEAAVITTTGNAEATRTRALGEATAVAEQALGLARAKGFEAQRRAIGAEQTALVAALREVAAGHVKIVPDIQVGSDSGILGGVGAMLMQTLARGESDGAAAGEDRPSELDEAAGTAAAGDGSLGTDGAPAASTAQLVEATAADSAATPPPEPTADTDT